MKRAPLAALHNGTNERYSRDSVPTILDWTGIHHQLTAILRRICPLWLGDRQQDLLQVAMLKVMAIEERRRGQTVWTPTYLSRMANSLLIDELRRRARQPEEPFDDQIADGIPATESFDPEGALLGRELGRALRESLAALVPARRQACRLHLLGFGYQEIASQLGWDPKKVENAICRGLADLRQSFAARGLVPSDRSRHEPTRKARPTTASPTCPKARAA